MIIPYIGPNKSKLYVKKELQENTLLQTVSCFCKSGCFKLYTHINLTLRLVLCRIILLIKERSFGTQTKCAGEGVALV